MAHVVMTLMPWRGSEHVSEEESTCLLVSDTTVNGILISALTPAEKAWKESGQTGDFEQDDPVTLTADDGFMCLTIRHPTPECYAALSELDPDGWENGSNEEKFVVLVSRLDIEILEPSYA